MIFSWRTSTVICGSKNGARKRGGAKNIAADRAWNKAGVGDTLHCPQAFKSSPGFKSEGDVYREVWRR
ncbi:MAG TPA: hypothetical protein VLA16_17895 [Ideonella sp.]|nr:hypothetical protein [Ideonella sp.]